MQSPPSKKGLQPRIQEAIYKNVTQPIISAPGKAYKGVVAAKDAVGKKIADTQLYQGLKTTYQTEKAAQERYNASVAEAIENPDADVSDAARSEAEALYTLLEAAEKRPKWSTGISRFFYNLNLVAAFAFDSLLFYTPGRTETPPDVVGFFTKMLVIAAAYVVINVILSVMIYGIFIPVFYASYASSYRCFQTFLRNQYVAYQTKFGVKLLEESGDLTTIGILAVFDTVANPTYNTSKNIGEYKSFINNDIGDALKAIQNPVFDDYTIQKVKDYFMGLPDEFKKHAKRKETYVYQSIQFWVVMLCTILFVIPIKYIILDGGNSPELPSALTGAVGKAMGAATTVGMGATNIINKMTTSKQKIAPEEASNAEAAQPPDINSPERDSPEASL